MLIQKISQFIRVKIAKVLSITTLICLLTVLQIGNASPNSKLVWQGNLASDKTITVFAEQGTGKLVFYDVQNLSNTGASLLIDVENNNTVDQLQLTFNGEIVDARFLNEGSIVASGKQRDITCCNPLSITILGGNLTIIIGEKNYTVNNVSAFKGSLTTRFLVGSVEAYR